MTVQQWMLVWKALMVVLPAIVLAVREGRIRAASQKEVLEVLYVKIDERVARARAARDDDSLPDPYRKK